MNFSNEVRKQKYELIKIYASKGRRLSIQEIRDNWKALVELMWIYRTYNGTLIICNGMEMEYDYDVFSEEEKIQVRKYVDLILELDELVDSGVISYGEYNRMTFNRMDFINKSINQIQLS